MSNWNVFVTFEESDMGQKTRRRTPECQTGKFPPLYREVRPPPLLSTVTWGEDNFNIFVICRATNSSSILFPLFFCKNSPGFLSSPPPSSILGLVFKSKRVELKQSDNNIIYKSITISILKTSREYETALTSQY